MSPRGMFLVQKMKDAPYFFGKEATFSEIIEKNRIYNPLATLTRQYAQNSEV
jgi:hypothetical protein